MAQVLNAFQKAYVRHAVAQEIEKRDGAAHTITDAAFADVMGVHPNTIKNTKKNPAVAEAVSFGAPDDKYGEVVAAAVVCRPGTTTGKALADDIRAHCGKVLAAFKVPQMVFFTEVSVRVREYA